MEEKALIRDIFYFGTSGQGAWYRDSPEKFGTVGIFVNAIIKNLVLVDAHKNYKSVHRVTIIAQ